MARKSKVYQVTDEEFRTIVSQANSYSDCLRMLGLTTKGGSSTDILKERIQELSCDISHFGTKKLTAANAKYTLASFGLELKTWFIEISATVNSPLAIAKQLAGMFLSCKQQHNATGKEELN